MTSRSSMRRRRPLLTVVTITWLLVLGVANLRQTDRLYPVTSYSMFSHPTGGLNVQLELDATTVAGVQRLLPPEDFGLTELQLRDHLARTVGSRPEQPRPEAEEAVARIAGIWTERNGAELSRLAVVRNERSVERPTAPVRTQIESWPR